ncbi:helix-turn-helix domain-containing protein [Dyella sp. 2RAB6]|uniref:helix-turn-helix domain-containing protein n=1 Tax=Dyella sp. 2RAB6 TaxID=3232992 RepID=UPI003F9237A5
MRAVHRLPAPPLRAAIDRYWSWDGADPLRLLPLMPSPGGLEVFFHYGAPFALDDAGARPLPRAHLVCVRTRPVALFQHGHTGFVAVRVRAGMGEHLTGVPVDELADRFVDARDIWGAAAGELLERLAEAASADERAALLDQFFLAHQHAQRHGAELAPALTALLHGQTSVADAAHEAGLGTRQLEYRFQHATGLSPARLRRLARLRRSIRMLLLAPPEATLTTLLDPAYHDQAQQVREFRELTGFTPGELRRAGPASAHFYNPSWPR